MRRLLTFLCCFLLAYPASAVNLKELRELYWRGYTPLIAPNFQQIVLPASGTTAQFGAVLSPGIAASTLNATKKTPIYYPGTVYKFVFGLNPNSTAGSVTATLYKNTTAELSCSITTSSSNYQQCEATGTTSFTVSTSDTLSVGFTTTQTSWASDLTQISFLFQPAQDQHANIFAGTSGSTTWNSGTTPSYIGPQVAGFSSTESTANVWMPTSGWITGFTVNLSGNDGSSPNNHTYYMCHNAASGACTSSSLTCSTNGNTTCTTSATAAPIYVSPTDTISIEVVGGSGSAPALGGNFAIGWIPATAGQYPLFMAPATNSTNTFYLALMGNNLVTSDESYWSMFPHATTISLSNLYAFNFNANSSTHTRAWNLRTATFAASPSPTDGSLSCTASATSTSAQGGGGNLTGISCKNTTFTQLAPILGWGEIKQVSTNGAASGGQKVSVVSVIKQ